MRVGRDAASLLSLLLTYTWLGYPLLLWILRRMAGRAPTRGSIEPTISVIVAVFNEEKNIAGKLQDCLALEYPRERAEFLVASDGSTDATEQIVEEFARLDSRIRLIRSTGRAGKSGVQNLAAAGAKGEIILFTDAETSTRPTLLRQIAEDFADNTVGLVAPTVHFGKLGSAVSEGQGAYWRFELFLRQLESDIGILATASGSAFAIRRELFRPIPPEYGDDCIVPLDVRLQGFKVIQDPRIIVYDEMPHTVNGELRARMRMTSRNWAGILSRPGVLNPLHFPGTAWSLISHKFLRWMTPLFLAGLYLVNCSLVVRREFILLFVLQSCFYAAALVGWRRSRSQSCERVFGYPFAFCLANLGFFLGIVRFFRRQHIIAYK
jgi:cellulose synthase/poly-beta-1,6-N-acetylglucosamine synthase-like glycosyltransferase